MKQVLWTSEQAKSASKGVLIPDMPWQANGISIDTRTLNGGDLFIALKDKRDGHAFIEHAFKAGASAALTEKIHPAGPCLVVENSFKAVYDLAVYARNRSAALRIAVTGSVGKTTIKEMLGNVFKNKGLTHISLRSFNNHIGVPVSLATLAEQAKYGVFEIGMNHAGEIQSLSELVKPDITLISKIAPAHLAHFKSIDEIVDAKSEVFMGQSINGVAVLNRDQPYYDRLSKYAKSKKLHIISFGKHQNADVRLIEFYQDNQQARGSIYYQNETTEFTLNTVGAHFGENANAVFAIALVSGLDLQEISNSLNGFLPITGRGQIHLFDIQGKSITVIDESYNANPESMRSALNILGCYQTILPAKKTRKIAVLGDMLELGCQAELFHREIVDILVEQEIDILIACGQFMKHLWQSAPEKMRFALVDNADQASHALNSILEDGDIILVKASNSMNLKTVIEGLRQE